MHALAVIVTQLVISADNVAGQFAASPPTCPGDTITFRCTIGGDSTGMTIWRVGGSNLDMCVLFHGRTASSTCGPGNHFVAVPETGFGTNATSFSSVLSRTATRASDGTQIGCLGLSGGGHLVHMDEVGESIIHVLGQ